MNNETARNVRVSLIAFGANLPTEEDGAPADTLNAALRRLTEDGDISVANVSPFYETAPVPVSDQPWYVNGVARLETALGAHDLLARLHHVEAEFGRVRRERNEARVIDLDLIAYGDDLLIEEGGIQVPHPRMHQRAFVLLPLRDIVPVWHHAQFLCAIHDRFLFRLAVQLLRFRSGYVLISQRCGSLRWLHSRNTLHATLLRSF